MQESIAEASSTSSDVDEVSRAEAEVAVRKAALARSLRDGSQGSEARQPGSGLKPTWVAAVAVAGLVAVAGVTIAMTRRRRARWLPPESPSALSTAARGAGMFLLRLVARQIANQIATKLDPAPAAASRAVVPIGIVP